MEPGIISAYQSLRIARNCAAFRSGITLQHMEVIIGTVSDAKLKSFLMKYIHEEDPSQWRKLWHRLS